MELHPGYTPEEMFRAYILGMDALTQSLIQTAKLIGDERILFRK